MKSSVWPMREAKNYFSEVVELARQEGRQTITKHGNPVAVILSMETFEQLSAKPSRSKAAGQRLVELLRRCPAPEVFERLGEALSREPARDLDLH